MLFTAKHPSHLSTSRRTAPARHVTSRPAAHAHARVVHRPPLTGFTSGVHEVHPLSRLRSSSIPGTELSYLFPSI
jgi:hypothetical protein